MAVCGEIVHPQRGPGVTRTGLAVRPDTAAAPATARGRRLVVVMRLAVVVTPHVGGRRDRIDLGLGPRGAEGVVRVRRRVVHVGAGSHAAALVGELHVPEHGVRVHGVVVTEGPLAAAGDDVEDDGREVQDEREHGEGEEDLVDAADHDTGRGAPGGRVAGGHEGARHAPAEKTQRHGPQEEEERVEDEGEEGRHAVVAAGNEGSEDEVDEGEEGGCCQLEG